MKRRGLTIVEVLIVMTIIGLITAAFFPMLIFEMKNVKRSYSFTQDAFEMQTLIEKQKLLLNEGKHNPSEWMPFKVKTFGGHEINVLSRLVETKEKDIGTENKYSRQGLIILPQDRLTKKNLPKITVTLSKGGTNFIGRVKYGKTMVEGVLQDDRDAVDFVVYRWYLTDLGKTPPTTNKADPSKLILIREHNIAKNLGHPRLFVKPDQFKKSTLREDEIYKDEEYKIIGSTMYAYIDGNPPLVNEGLDGSDKLAGDTFRPDSLNHISSGANNFSSDDMKLLYNNKGLVFSAMYVTKDGEVGEETYSEIKDLGYHYEEFFVGQSKDREDAGGAYKAKFFIKQVYNMEKNREVSFLFFRKDDGTRFYPMWSSADKCYHLVTSHAMGYAPTPPKFNLDDDGYKTFEVMIPKTEKLGIYFKGRSSNLVTAYVE